MKENNNILNEKSNVTFYNEQDEKELLGYFIMDNKNLESVEDELDVDFFHFDLHQKIYKAITELINQNYKADERTLYYELEGKINLTKKELEDYIANLVDSAISSISTPKELSFIIHKLYLKKSLYNISNNIKDLVLDSSNNGKDINIEEQINLTEKMIYDIANKSAFKQEIKEIKIFTKILKDKLSVARNTNREISGVTTGFKELDRYTGGLQNSDLIILAARPSMGKSALAVTIARNIARIAVKTNYEHQHGIAFFSLEMSGEQIAARIVSMESNYTVKAIHTGRKGLENDKISDSDFMSIVDVMSNVENLPIYVDDTPALSIAVLRSRARYLKRRYNISAIVIDYLQMLKSTIKNNNQSNRVQEVAEITQTLKAIAKELSIPVIALSQLSRAVEGRDDKKPQLSDLRESGTIEQDADIVMFLYREAYYLERKEKKVINENNQDEINAKDAWDQQYEPIKNLAELMIAKNRNGPIGNIILHFNKETMEFSNHIGDSNNTNSKNNIVNQKKNNKNINSKSPEGLENSFY